MLVNTRRRERQQLTGASLSQRPIQLTLFILNVFLNYVAVFLHAWFHFCVAVFFYIIIIIVIMVVVVVVVLKWNCLGNRLC